VAVPQSWNKWSRVQTRPAGDDAQRDPDVSMRTGMGSYLNWQGRNLVVRTSAGTGGIAF
jgi:hypothetical protein